MRRPALFAILLAMAAVIGAAAVSSPDADAGKPCWRKAFKTKLVHDACATDQDAAKDAMKKFVKDANKAKNLKLICATCHAKVGGDYPLKDNGLKRFTDAGGELLAP